MAYKDKLRSAKKVDKKIELDKAGGEMQNFGNNDANGVCSSFGNKIRAFCEGGWTRNEYIGFGATFGILVTAVLVAGVAMACINIQDFDTEAFDKVGIDLKKFGNYVEKAVDNAKVDFEKIICDVQESLEQFV